MGVLGGSATFGKATRYDTVAGADQRRAAREIAGSMIQGKPSGSALHVNVPAAIQEDKWPMR